MGMTHVRTSECIRPKSPVTQEDAKQLLEIYVNDYNAKRLHSAIGYIPPLDKLEGVGCQSKIKDQ